MAQLPEHLNTNTNTTSSVIHQKGCLSARQKSTMTIRTIFLNYSLEKNDLAIGKFGQGARYQTLISIWPQGRDWAMNRTSMFNNELYDASLGRPVKPWRWGPASRIHLLLFCHHCRQAGGQNIKGRRP